MLTWRTGWATDVGRRRNVNEDSVFVGANVLAIADGMGGHASGDVASALTMERLESLERLTLRRPEDVVRAVIASNADILAYAGEHTRSAGMGTTATGVVRVSVGGADHWVIFNVGDSRVYQFTTDDFACATIDHSEVEELVRQGRLTSEEARTHPCRNVVTRSLGTIPPPVVDTWVLPQTDGERFLVCSDGLTSEVDDRRIEEILGSVPDPQEAADLLLEAALAAGGRDNVSVIVADVTGQAGTSLDAATNPRRHDDSS